MLNVRFKLSTLTSHRSYFKLLYIHKFSFIPSGFFLYHSAPNPRTCYSSHLTQPFAHTTALINFFISSTKLRNSIPEALVSCDSVRCLNTIVKILLLCLNCLFVAITVITIVIIAIVITIFSFFQGSFVLAYWNPCMDCLALFAQHNKNNKRRGRCLPECNCFSLTGLCWSCYKHQTDQQLQQESSSGRYRFLKGLKLTMILIKTSHHSIFNLQTQVMFMSNLNIFGWSSFRHCGQ